MIDFGWYLKLNHDITRANTQGARVAAYSGNDTAVTEAIIGAASSPLNISEADVSIERASQGMERGSSVTITTNSSYSSITNFSVVHFLLDGKELSSTSTIRIE